MGGGEGGEREGKNKEDREGRKGDNRVASFHFVMFNSSRLQGSWCVM